MTTKNFRFSDFELDGARRLLLKDGEPVSLNPKTFDLLFVLVQNRGGILTKDELLERVWPGQFVEEGNLKVHISALRKAFGERKNEHRFIVTVPGRGYSFVADLDENSNGDIIIEKHSLSRIVVDEEVRDYQAGTINVSHARHIVPHSFPNRNRFVIVALAALAGISAAAIGFSIYRRGADSTARSAIRDFQIKRLTSNGRVSFAALSPDGKLFAYALKELEQNSLWLGFVEGGSDVELRPSETGRYNDLAFSADGNNVLFTFSGADSRESVLYRVPTFGGAREKIREHVASLSVSPDAEHYAFARFDSKAKTNEIVVASIAAREEEEKVIQFPGLRSLSSESLSWSPDGSEIAFGASADVEKPFDQVLIVDISDGAVRRVTEHGWKEVIKTAWIDGGSGLLLVAQEKGSNTSVSYSQVWEVKLPGGEAQQLTHDLSSYRSVLNAANDIFLSVELRQMNNIWVAPSENLGDLRQVTFGTFGKYDGLWGLDWTANGKIVFTSTDNQSQVISQMDADGGNVIQLTSPGFEDSMLNTSNDGRYIVFQSSRSGGSDIWRMSSDGSDVVRLTTDGKSSQPFISPDSRFVYYRSNRDGDGALYRTSIDGGEAEKISSSEVSYISISPDGKYVAAATGTRLVIISSGGSPAEKGFELSRFGTGSANTRWTPDGRAIAYRDRGFGYWLQPIEGGEPVRMKGLPKEKFYNFAWSKDGKQFAFVRGQEIRDVVLFHRSH